MQEEGILPNHSLFRICRFFKMFLGHEGFDSVKKGSLKRCSVFRIYYITFICLDFSESMFLSFLWLTGGLILLMQEQGNSHAHSVFGIHYIAGFSFWASVLILL